MEFYEHARVNTLLFIYLILTMNSKDVPDEVDLQSQKIKEFIKIYYQYKGEYLTKPFFQYTQQLTHALKQINVQNLSQERVYELVSPYFETTVYRLTNSDMLIKDKTSVYYQLVKIIAEKILTIFKRNKMYQLAISTFREIFKFSNSFFYKQSKASKGFFGFGAGAEKQLLPTDEYLALLNYLKEQFSKCPKQVWNMELQQIISMFQLFNDLEKSKNTKTEVHQLYDAYFTQLCAYYQSGREELVKHADYGRLYDLSHTLKKSLEAHTKKQKYEFVLPTLSKTLITMGKANRIVGIKLLNIYCKKMFNFDYSAEGDRLRNWLNKNEIVLHILTKQMNENEYDEAKYIFKAYSKSMFGKIKTNQLLKILRDNNNQNKWVSKFCLKQMDIYNMEDEQRISLVEYLQKREDIFTNYPDYFEILDNLAYKIHQNETLVAQPLFNIFVGIVEESFNSLSISLQNKIFTGLKLTAKGLRGSLRNKSAVEKVQYCKKILGRILKKIDISSILMFNAIFDEGDLSKMMSNNPFQGLMNYVIQQMNFLDRIFEFLSTVEMTQINQIVKAIKFVTNKCSIKIDVTQKYIKTLSKFPELYETLLENEGYQKVHCQMQSVLQLFRYEPDTPFHMLKTTFLKLNFKKLSQYKKVPSLLEKNKEQNILMYNPNQLQSYEEIISLMEEAPSQHLLQQIAEFIANLHMNYFNDEVSLKEKLSEYMESVVEYFKQNTKSYRKHEASAKSILANFELILQMMKFTDILGVGLARPHSSLVSTKTISLTIVNNATFGDDIKKSVSGNFPANMILFDLLTTIGLDFKCGPEDLILSQGGRVIQVINNGRVLEDLQLTSEEIIAEKNEANLLKTPEIIVKLSNGTQKVNDVYEKCLREVFDRFAYDGKMGQIQAINYFRQVSGSHVMAYDRRIKDMFEDFDKDKDGMLTFMDFWNYCLKDLSGFSFRYYQKQFLTGLQNLRYRKNMTLYSQPLDISDRYPYMMRYVIQKYSEVYKELFTFTSDQNQQIANKARQLLLYLPTDLKMKEMKPDMFNFKNNSQFFILYKLIVIENSLSYFDNTLEEQERKNQKMEKIKMFIENKYNQVIFQLLEYFYKRINENQYIYNSFTICLKILRSLIDVDNLTKTKISTLKIDVKSIHQLPSTTFFAEQAIKALNTKNVINFEVLLVLQLTQKTINIKPIIEACFNQDEDIRRTCCNFVYIWESKINWKDNLFDINIPDNYSLEWFDLLSAIIKTTQIQGVKELLHRTILNIDKFEENIYNRQNALLCGYLKIMLALLVKYINLGEEEILKDRLPKLLEKTFSEKSRSLVYSILIVVDNKLLLNYFNHMLGSVLPSQQCQIRTQYMGLKNLGATCYMNSIIQQFFMIEKFRYLVLNKKIPKEQKMVQVGGKMIVDDFMYQLQRMYFNLQYSQKKSYVPKDFCYANKDYDGKPINTSIQEDSHEFLNRLVQNMQNLCKIDDTLPVLQELCEVRTLSEYQCSECKNRIDKIENHYSCMLEVKQQASLADSLRRMTDKQQIEDYTCENCKKKVKSITKRTYFYELPEIIILNLQRIIFDPKKGDKIKVHSSLPFPMQLDLQDYLKNQDVKQTKYYLKGVVIHTGTSQGGHYYSLIRDNTSSQQKWLKFNDQNVISFEEKQIQREGFGGFESKDNDLPESVSYSTNAYILFYERADAKKNEMCDIENYFSEQVQMQNQKLIKQVQVHQECFFTAINRMYYQKRFNNISESVKKQPFLDNQFKDPARKQFYMALLDIHQKALSFISVFTSLKNETRSRIAENLVQMYHLLPQCTSTFFKQINIGTFTENLLTHSDSLHRQSIKRIFSRNLVTYLIYYGINIDDPERQQSKIVRNILDHILSQIQDQKLFANLGKAECYFQLLLQLVRTHHGVRKYLITKNIMFYLLDLIMGRQSLYMKHHPKAQDLPTNIVNIIFEILGSIISCKQNRNGAHSTDKSYAPYFQTTSIQQKILLNPTFYRRIFRFNYEHKALIFIILHYAYQDPDYTLMICDILSTQLPKADHNCLKFLIQIYQKLLTTNDSLQQLRYSCLLGFSQCVETYPHNFCLKTSDQSCNTHYVTGYGHAKKSLLEMIFNQRQNHQLVIFCLKLVLQIAQSSETFYDYFMKLPPPSYLKASLLDCVMPIITRLSHDQNLIIDKKAERITQIKSLYEILKERMAEKKTKVPIKPYIIGKTTAEQIIDKLQTPEYTMELIKYTTYVLDNIPVPESSHNKSMNKDFRGYEPYGIANLFIDYRSKKNYKPPQEVKQLPTVYAIKGKTKQKLIVTCKQSIQNFRFIIGDGQFIINFLYTKELKIQDLILIEIHKDELIQVEPELLTQIFGVQQQQKMVEQEKTIDPNASPMKEEVPFGKIECGQCTYLNDLTSERCQMCDNLIFM